MSMTISTRIIITLSLSTPTSKEYKTTSQQANTIKRKSISLVLCFKSPKLWSSTTIISTIRLLSVLVHGQFQVKHLFQTLKTAIQVSIHQLISRNSVSMIKCIISITAITSFLLILTIKANRIIQSFFQMNIMVMKKIHQKDIFL